jgi:hypothetical protein
VATLISKLLTAIALGLLLTSATADELRWTSQRGLFTVSYRSELRPIQINKLHAWVVHIETAAGRPLVGATIEVSGGMPMHNHGLPTRPRVTAELGGGDYRVDGMRFHMTGQWEITLRISADGKSDTVVIALNL